jgi:hypothetical protein
MSSELFSSMPVRRRRVGWPRALSIALFLFSESAVAADWQRAVGAAEIVLPGFEPVSADTHGLALGAERRYEWSDSTLLPHRLTRSGIDVVSAMKLEATIEGREVELEAADAPRIETHNGHHAVIHTRTTIAGLLEVRIKTRVEYDGVAMVELTLMPVRKVRIDRLSVRMSVDAPSHARGLRFSTVDLRKRRKQFVFPVEYSGPFLSAYGIAAGSHSFWWFADDGAGRIVGPAPTLVVRRTDAGRVDLVDTLIAAPLELTAARSVRFNYLVTPVRASTGWRDGGIALNTSRDEGRYGKYFLWWTDAFAHVALPYTELPNGAAERIPRQDVAAYKGPAEARRVVARARLNGIEAIPYFSAHALSALDPVRDEHLEAWKAVPPYVVPNSNDGPFESNMKRPYLSHRSHDFTDYLLDRLGVAIGEMRVPGLYFDQAGIIDSVNPAHGWRDDAGRLHAATDILGMRSFFKRLATLFHEQGLPGHIFVHNSASPVIPAYTFVTGMIQGEEYRLRLPSAEYVGNVDLDEIRAAFSPGQYGIATYWLSELWSPKLRPRGYPDQRSWMASGEYTSALQGFLGLALLHDVPTWSMAPLAARRPLAERLARFGVVEAEFKGYWATELEPGNDSLRVSHFLHANGMRVLAVVMNLEDEPAAFRLRGFERLFRCTVPPGLILAPSMRRTEVRIEGDQVSGTVGGADFVLVEVGLRTEGAQQCGK